MLLMLQPQERLVASFEVKKLHGSGDSVNAYNVCNKKNTSPVNTQPVSLILLTKLGRSDIYIYIYNTHIYIYIHT